MWTAFAKKKYRGFSLTDRIALTFGVLARIGRAITHTFCISNLGNLRPPKDAQNQ